MFRIATVVLLSTLVCAAATANDSDNDTVLDSIEITPPAQSTLIGDVAIVDTGSSSINNFTTRLTGLGYTVATIPLNSGYSTFMNYDAVLLPVSHGSAATIGTFQAMATDYMQYVNDGGCLYICQPNPWDLGGQQAVITWAPYLLEVSALYNSADCPPTIVAPDHCVAAGLQPTDLAFPGDTVLNHGPEWTVINRGPVTNSPGVMFASYGSGNVIVEFGHPNPAAICAYTDAGLDQMMDCCLSGSVPVDASTWGNVKTIYRD